MISSREKKSGLFAHASRGARPLGRTGQWWVMLGGRQVPYRGRYAHH